MPFLLLVVVTAALAVLQPVAAAAQEVSDGSYVAPDGSRVLRQSIEVTAPRLELWQALTTSAGVRSWAVPVAELDLRLGGIWESSYRPDAVIGDPANIKNRILSYLPPTMFSFQAIQAPPGFPHRELLEEIFTVIELQELEPALTRVTVSMVGYEAGEGYDVIYRLFERGNGWTLRQLRERFITGPVDWAARLGAQPDER